MLVTIKLTYVIEDDTPYVTGGGGKEEKEGREEVNKGEGRGEGRERV